MTGEHVLDAAQFPEIVVQYAGDVPSRESTPVRVLVTPKGQQHPLDVPMVVTVSDDQVAAAGETQLSNRNSDSSRSASSAVRSRSQTRSPFASKSSRGAEPQSVTGVYSALVVNRSSCPRARRGSPRSARRDRAAASAKSGSRARAAPRCAAACPIRERQHRVAQVRSVEPDIEVGARNDYLVERLVDRVEGHEPELVPELGRARELRRRIPNSSK